MIGWVAVEYGTGRDTLRCLALATADSPANPKVLLKIN